MASSMSTPTTPTDASPPPPSTGAYKKPGPPPLLKLTLPHEAEQWLQSQFTSNPKPDAEDMARWLLQVKKWNAQYTMPHLTSWIRTNRSKATRLRNAAEKQRQVAEAQMEAQVFPAMTDLMKTTLRGFYTLEEQPSQSLMNSWAAALELPTQEVARWINWKRAMDDTMRSKSTRVGPSSTGAAAPVKHETSAAPISAHHTPPLPPVAQPPPAPPRIPHRSTGGHAVASGSASPGFLPHPQHHVQLAFTTPHRAQPPPGPARQPTPRTVSQPGVAWMRPRSATTPNAQYFAAPYAQGQYPGPPGAVVYPGAPPMRIPHPLPPRPPPPRQRDSSMPPIAVLEHGQPLSPTEPGPSMAAQQRRRVPPISTDVVRAGPSNQQFAHAVSPHELKPDVSTLSRPSTAPTHIRRRSGSPSRLSPLHRRDGPPPRRASPPPSTVSSPGHPFRYNASPAGSPSASMSVLSATGAHAAGESEPPLTPSPSPTRAIARYSPESSETSSSSRTVTAGPLVPLFTELAFGLHKAGLDSGYPLDTSALATDAPSVVRRLSASALLSQFPGASNANATPAAEPAALSFSNWYSRLPAGVSTPSMSERRNAEIESQNAEMLRDIESGAFSHLGVGLADARPSEHVRVIKREPEA